MLQLDAIRKSYVTGGFEQTALNEVSISFRDSEFVSVLGPSGSGKTTLLNILGGLDHYDSGNLIIDGISTKKFKDRDWDAYRNNRIGFVFQSYNLIPHQSVLSNVELALTLSGVSHNERQLRAKEALERVGLAEHINKKPSQLSGGQMQRVAIARALINDPEILLADEPTGALDSKTSLQIMDLLTEIAHDRLVIMVTHNPELARRYATRIVNLADGAIVSDNNPYTPSDDDTENLRAKPSRYTHMSPLTALSLSFNNLMTKKGRTFMTAIAGSIGIIGIAAILALANGVNNYIATVEEETLSAYPLQIMSSGLDLTSLLIPDADDGDTDDNLDEEQGQSSDSQTLFEEAHTPAPTDHIGEQKTMSRIFSSIASNDLKALKQYFDSGDSAICDHASSIYYKYAVTPQIFSTDTSHGARQINPDTTFSSLGVGSNTSTNSLMSMMNSTDQFSEMSDNNSTITNQYEVVAGDWPKGKNELVLVLSSSGKISDFLTYILDLRDPQELKEMVKKFVNEQDVAIPEDELEINYDDVIGKTFKLVYATDYYKHDDERNVWVDKSDDKKFMKHLVKKGDDLVITGIVKPTSDATASALTTGIYYTSALTRSIVEKAAQTDIVKEQLKHSKRDVFTGKNFDDEAENKQSNFDMNSLFDIDESALAAAFAFDTDSLSNDLSQIEIDSSALNFDDVSQNLDMSDLLNGNGGSGSESNIFKDIDPASLFDPSELSSIDLSGINTKDLIDSTTLAEGINKIFEPTTMMNWMLEHGYTNIMQGLSAYLKDPSTQAQFSAAIGAAINTKSLGKQIGTAVKEQVSSVISRQLEKRVMPKLVEAIQTQISSQMTSAIERYISHTMSQTVDKLTEQLKLSLSQSFSQLSSNMKSAMNVDPAAFSKAFNFNLSEEELSELMMTMVASESASFDNNLKKLGYADFDKPSEIDIYPKDFDSKADIISILDDYNKRMKETDENKVISYTDIVGTLMQSVTTIVNMISTVLIAFVAISLIVSSIMIGVITYISVLERRKEIGILRSIGASKRDISHVFNAETIIEGLIAGLLGVGVTALGCIPANIIVDSIFDIKNVAILPVEAGAILVAISVVLTFIAGLIPSKSASRKDPVEALRSE